MLYCVTELQITLLAMEAVQAIRGPVQAIRGPVQAIRGPVQAIRGPVQAIRGPAAAMVLETSSWDHRLLETTPAQGMDSGLDWAPVAFWDICLGVRGQHRGALCSSNTKPILDMKENPAKIKQLNMVPHTKMCILIAASNC